MSTAIPRAHSFVAQRNEYCSTGAGTASAKSIGVTPSTIRHLGHHRLLVAGTSYLVATCLTHLPSLRRRNGLSQY
jgi:hypothetical protein